MPFSQCEIFRNSFPYQKITSILTNFVIYVELEQRSKTILDIIDILEVSTLTQILYAVFHKPCEPETSEKGPKNTARENKY